LAKKQKRPPPLPPIPELEPIKARLRTAREAVRGLEHELEDAKLKLVNERLGTSYSDEDCVLVFGIHECPKSPTHACVYNDEEDPSHDGCLFCHGPHERK